MDRISIFNYEAFYLDFLEGNLSEADTLLLMNFLDENPDLKVDMYDVLPELFEESTELDDISKLLLKSTNDDTVINLKNVDYFIVARTEGLLDAVKQKELASFIAGNPDLEKECTLADLIAFHPDLDIVYEDKTRLKKKTRVLVLWPYASSIAAASVVLFFWSVLDTTTLPVNPTRIKTSSSGTSVGMNSTQIDPVIIGSDEQETLPNIHPKLANSTKVNGNEANENSTKQYRVNDMKRRSAGPIALINEKKLAPITAHTKAVKPSVASSAEDALALSPYTSMHNPIEPLTKFVSKKTNTEIEFQTTKKVEDERRGFHLKIGKFEISRKKGH